MDPIISDFKQSIEKAISHLMEDLKSIRTGKANPSLVENIVVETYGGQSKLRLMELSTIMANGPSGLIVTPFDSTILSDIEKAILKSPLGVSPVIQGNKIILKFPPLSQEQREKLAKVAQQNVEETKQIIRNHRDDARKKIKQLHESKEMTEDEKFRIEKVIDIQTHKLMETIQKVKESKEKEIMEI